MDIDQTITYLKQLKVNKHNNQDLSLYDKHTKWSNERYGSYDQFISILSDLKNLPLEADKLRLIEEKIDSLDLQKSVRNKQRYIFKRMKTLEKYLLKDHSIVQRGFYATAGLIYGSILGCLVIIPAIIFSSSMVFISIVLIIGFGLGLYCGGKIGQKMDLKALGENRVLLNSYFSDKVYPFIQ